jgi:CheY-like chemotaxis protein
MASMQEKVLVVDDEKGIIDVLRIMLKKECGVEFAMNGKEALEKLRDQSFAAIISDIKMPIMDGIEFYTKAVEEYPYTRTKFLFLTGFSSVEHTKFFEMNNLKCLSKPSQMKDIKKAVTEIIAG